MDESIIEVQLKGQREYNAVMVSLGVMYEHLTTPGAAVVIDEEMLANRLSFETSTPITADEIPKLIERIGKLIHLCKYCGDEFDGSFGFDLCEDCTKNQASKQAGQDDSQWDVREDWE